MVERQRCEKGRAKGAEGVGSGEGYPLPRRGNPSPVYAYAFCSPALLASKISPEPSFLRVI